MPGSTDAERTLVDGLWERLGSLRLEDVPAEVRTIARQCALDWYGCAVAGSVEPATTILAEELANLPGPAAVIATGRHTGALPAALINGTAGHALDYDDASTVMGGHPTAPVLPAVLALAQERGASGAAMLAAFIAGVEIETRLGLGLGASHYARGWHVTSTVGVIGAAAACAHLLGLDAEAAGRALAIAASSSSGLKANFGTMTKPLHAGQAAERGQLAARLAARGFTSDVTALGAPQGLAEAAADGQLDLARIARHGDGWLIGRTLFKYHAACYLTHASIEAAGMLRGEVDPAALESITVTVNPTLLDVCAIPRPSTGLETKFSLAATTAFALLGADTTDTATFSDDGARDPDVVRLTSRVAVVTDPSLRTTQARVALTTDGTTVEGFHDTGRPASDLGRQGDKLRTKFHGLVAPILGEDDARRLATDLERLDELEDVSVLT